MQKNVAIFFMASAINAMFLFLVTGYAQDSAQEATNMPQSGDSQTEIIIQPMTEIVIDKNNQPTAAKTINVVDETIKETEQAAKKKAEEKIAAEDEEKGKEETKEKNPEEWADEDGDLGTFSNSRQGIWKTGGGDDWDIRDDKSYKFRP